MFQIPGLGQAKPNEVLPAANFATAEPVVTADSIMDVEALDLGSHQSERTAHSDEAKSEPSEELSNPTTARDNQKDDIAMAGDDNMTPTPIPDAAFIPTAPSVLSAPTSPSTLSAVSIAASIDVGKETNLGQPESPDVTQALEVALQAGEADRNMEDAEAGNADEPEFMEDSDPYQSPSDDSSDDSSEDSSEDDSNDEQYSSLSAAQLALDMMKGDPDDSDDETGKPKKVEVLRTKNEEAEKPLPKPDVVITPEMKIERLGIVKSIVYGHSAIDSVNTVVIQSDVPGELRAIDMGCVLCKEDRTVIGALADTIGKVEKPMYLVTFNSRAEIEELQLSAGTVIYYSIDHANFIFTQELKTLKGTDASNIHDEEVAPEEMEFSDDEKEAEAKQKLKQKKRDGKPPRGGRGGRGGFPRGGDRSTPAPVGTLNYGEDDEEGPYRPLARPASFGQGALSLPPIPPKPEGGFSAVPPPYPIAPPFPQNTSQRNLNSSRSRGDFQRGGRANYQRNDRNNSYSRPQGGPAGNNPTFASSGRPDSASGTVPPLGNFPVPIPPPNLNPHFPPPPFGLVPPPPPPSMGNVSHWPAPPAGYTPPVGGYPHPPQPPAAPFNYNFPAWNQSQGQAQPPQPQQQPASRHYGQAPAHPSWPNAGAPAAPSAGAYNPTFFNGANQQPPQQPAYQTHQQPTHPSHQQPVPQPPQQQTQQYQAAVDQYWAAQTARNNQGPQQ
ncbi:Gar1/Naf1 RNA binding region-domain-containing protein [Podospora didyma]|uniref:H/ACA ribonucleoprotein complex non-core subunit NAF1 n=1 Tax=Podospora didyma TaxID=330526 RepID=A0AAE0U3M2_9PEZI|nr:Gar1/Naf1 RNA binding region-domain-containing protein [Podospora didyma]